MLKGDDTYRPTVLSYGLGVDSTAILLGWLLDPESRAFGLEDLIVVTAHVGDEFASTIDLVERYMLPILREYRVRFVQLGRKGKTGLVVLDDSREPQKLYWDGSYRVSDEYRSGGTIPQTAGNRKCSMRAKGEVIDAWLLKEFGDVAFDHVIGFEADEVSRAERDAKFVRALTRKKSGRMPNRFPWYPLIDWGWTREVCVAYIEACLGVVWLKSACAFCPFSRGRGEVMERFMREPEAAHLTLELEFLARSLNPRAKLYLKCSALEKMADAGLHSILSEHERRIRCAEWALYCVVRVFTHSGSAVRKLEILHVGSRAAVDKALDEVASVEGLTVEADGDGFRRAWLSRRRTVTERVRSGKSFRKRERVLPCIESFLVASLSGAEAKMNRAFDTYYQRQLEADRLDSAA